MVKNRLNPILFTSVTLTCLAVILQGCKKAEEPPPPSQPVSAATEPVAAPAPPPAPTPPPSSVLSNIPSAEAQQHIGQTNRVCGLVASARFLESAKGQPTFLNFDHPYPDHTFTVAIFARDRPKFTPPPETLYEGKTVCVTGLIVDYRGKPEIVVQEPSQIVIEASIPAAAGGTTTNSEQQLPTVANPP